MDDRWTLNGHVHPGIMDRHGHTPLGGCPIVHAPSDHRKTEPQAMVTLASCIINAD